MCKNIAMRFGNAMACRYSISYSNVLNNSKSDALERWNRRTRFVHYGRRKVYSRFYGNSKARSRINNVQTVVVVMIAWP